MAFCKGSSLAGRVGLMAGLALIGLASGPLPDTGAWACARNKPMGPPAERVFELKIEGGQIAVDARTVRVLEKDTVHLHWSADAPLVLRLQAYGIEQAVEPGAVTEVTFEANMTGRFPFEAVEKGASRAAAQERNPIGYLEVYPR